MAPVVNTRILFNEVPKGYPDPQRAFKVDRSQTFDIETVQLNGGIAVKVLVLSIDPYLRHRMREPGNSEFNSSAFTIGEPIDNFGVAVVLKSEDPLVSAGEHLCGIFYEAPCTPSGTVSLTELDFPPLLAFAEYAVLPNATNHQKVVKPAGNLPWSVYVGVSGWPGKSAYYGYLEYIQDYAKKGDTLFVTTGAGPVGSFVIQLAKKQGLKVIASAGSEEKVKFMKECGADVAFNYKTTSTKDILAQHGPINFYWDHVGGEVLDLALEAAAPSARIIVVGLSAGYNQQHVPLKNYPHILFKTLIVQGYVVMDWDAKYSKAFYEEIPPKVESGEIKHLEYIKRGIEKAGEMVVDVQTGKNLGKAILIVADE